MCSGVGVSLPVLQPVVAPVESGVLAGTLNPLLSGLAGNINLNLTSALSGQPLSVSVIDANGNLIAAPSGGCSLTTGNANGITLGGGQLDGLGGSGNGLATAGAPSAIAIGNGAATAAGVTGALALGSGASVTVPGGVALGAGAVAGRLNDATELFTGSGLRSTLGVVSVGSPGQERQIANVAGGTRATDAVNLRQLQAASGALSTALGAGAAFGSTSGAFTAPSYVIGGTTYRDVGAAIAAVGSLATNGLVQQAGSGAPITIGAAANGGTVSVAGTDGNRIVTGLAPGFVAIGSSDAVTGAQLATRQVGIVGTATALGGGTSFNPVSGAFTAPNYVVGGATYTDVGSAIAAVGSLATNGLVQQAGPGAPITIGAAADGDTISAAGTSGTRVLTGLGPGLVAIGSSDAVTGAQLATRQAGILGTVTALGGGTSFDPVSGIFMAPSYVIGGTTYTDVGSAIAAISFASTAPPSTIVQQGGSNGQITVGATSGGDTVTVAGTTGRRFLTGLRNGTIGPGSADAVTGDQIATRDGALARAVATFGGGASVDPNTGSYTAPTYTLRGTTYGDVGAALTALASDPLYVAQSGATAPLTVGAGTGGASVDFTGTAGRRVLTGLSAGRIAAGSADAVTGAQILPLATGVANAVAVFGAGATLDPATGALTLPSFVVGTQTYSTVGQAIAALGQAITNSQSGSGSGNGTSTAFPIAGNNLNERPPVASGLNSVAGGYGARALAQGSSAYGDSSLAQGIAATSIGGQSQALGLASTALGARSMAADEETTAVGGLAVARFLGSTAVGSNAQAIADPTTAVGYYATASGIDAVVVGAYGTASGDRSTVVGALATASGVNATAMGHSASASGLGATALGMGAVASADGSIAIGAGSVADRQNASRELFTGLALRSSLGTVSVGSAGNERQITNVAGGTAPTDAVNLRQLQSVGTALATSLGGGAGFDAATGAYTAPTYAVQGRAYASVGSAVAALDGASVKYDLNPDGTTNTAAVTLGAPGTPVRLANVTAGRLAVGSTDAVNGGQLFDTNRRVDTLSRNALQYDIDPATGQAGNTVTLAGGDPNRPVLVRNLASGVVASDAATVGQVRAAQASAAAYTDGRVSAALQTAVDYTDQQIAAATASYDRAFAQVNQDLREVRREARGAAALGLAAASLRYDDRPGKLSVAAGGGAWRGEGAAAFGAGYTSQNGLARFNLGASTTGGRWGVGGGLSLTLN